MTAPAIRVVLGMMLGMFGLTSAQAALVTYTDRAAFDTAITGFSQSTLDFDGATAGDLIADGGSLGGITFSYPTLAGFGVSLMVTDVYDTTSSPNFLGTDDADVLQDGDDFALGFAATNAIGMYFLTADELLDDDILLSVGGTTASLIAADLQTTLADGTDVYFLGIVDATTTFSSASVVTSNGDNGFFLWNVDDIVTAAAPRPDGGVPLPASLALLGLGLVALGVTRRRSGSAV